MDLRTWAAWATVVGAVATCLALAIPLGIRGTRYLRKRWAVRRTIEPTVEVIEHPRANIRVIEWDPRDL